MWVFLPESWYVVRCFHKWPIWIFSKDWADRKDNGYATRISAVFRVEEGPKLNLIGGGSINVHFSLEGSLLMCRYEEHLDVHILES